MEEWVGQKWHHYITKKSSFHYPKAVINLVDISKSLAVFFRALGGDAGMTLGHTSALKNHSHRNWVQKISGTGKKSESGHFNNDHFYLPEKIDYFPDQKSNVDLYYWLAAIGSFNHSPMADKVIEHNQLLTHLALQQWPGLKPLYQRLLDAQLQQRPSIKSLPAVVQPAEIALQGVLKNPHSYRVGRYDPDHMPAPVKLWLRPLSLSQALSLSRNEPSEQKPAELSDAIKKAQKNKRYQAEDVADNDGKDGFISFRLESMFSWSEFINVDRTEDDSDDEDAFRVADDLDQLSINQGETSHKLRLDLDLPASDYDDVLIEQGIMLPEWDYKKQIYHANYCALQLMQLRVDEKTQWSETLKQQASLLKRQFEALKPVSTWHNRQADGEEIDLNAVLDFKADQQLRQQQTESLLYRQQKKQNRDLSSLILTDLSLSTDAHVNDEKKVIDVIKEALYLLSSGLDAAGERFAIAGFTSKKRSQVRYYNIKGFDDAFDAYCEEKIQAMKPAYYTRMGTAIRYASEQLKQQQSQQKLLLILTDGKPNDLDKYETRYGLEDTKKAVQEARDMGLTPFCVSIDYEASTYLPYLFGAQGFIHLNNALDLPRKLPKLFFQLVT
ncbi:VWA domain-containing protein [Marinicella sp. S1101]|uniref:nitric oxide reductase activation protein NorD n=1 Tax=Marinicella marina TaxID=2996016 RepID=UPI002260B53C|nr:VWA domain-containing protein [Marinicella marina]MCX7552446.1 VWA domain-containing protein [Marinicella marina]MDJ1139321.1 VWA domain-containing protein [Marinicella marina]